MKIPEGLGWTALMTAYARAQERRRPDALVDDPWASRVIEAATGDDVDESGLPKLGPANDSGEPGLWSSMQIYFAARTPFYDEYVMQAVGEGVRQVVLLAAGFDARAYRLSLPAGTQVFEVDSDSVLSFKERVLAAATVPTEILRRTVRADLRDDWPSLLVEAGFDPQRPTMWVIEGLFMYLDADESDHLLSRLTAVSGAGSRLATEYFERNPAGERCLLGWADDEERRAGKLLGDLFRSGPAAPPRAWLASHGWKAADVTHVGEQATRRGRSAPWIVDPDHPDGLRIHLLAGCL